eukprot:1154864-Pelagomonas_calceolata.AAC.2
MVKQGKTKKCHSGGEYKSSLKDGVDDKFQYKAPLASWLSYERLEDQLCVFMHEMLRYLHRCSSAPVAKPPPLLPNQAAAVTTAAIMGAAAQTSRSQQKKKQASEPATVASRASQFWAQLESTGGCFRCPEWMKLTELVLSWCLSPQRSSLKEKHINVCAQGFKSIELDFMSFPYPDAIGRWLDAKKKHGRYMV